MDMGWVKRPEVAMIERGELGLAQSFDQREHARINDADVEIPVLTLDLKTATQVGQRRLMHDIDAVEQILEKCRPDLGVQPLVTPVVEFREHERRNDQILG